MVVVVVEDVMMISRAREVEAGKDKGKEDNVPRNSNSQPTKPRGHSLGHKTSAETTHVSNPSHSIQDCHMSQAETYPRPKISRQVNGIASLPPPGTSNPKDDEEQSQWSEVTSAEVSVIF